MKGLFIVCGLAFSFLMGCTTVQRGTAAGAVLGGGLGAVIGNQSGNAGEGAAIGAAVGAIGGAIIGEQLETKFCTQCGRRYTSSVEYCPYDAGELKLIEDKNN